jgi:hypothetical protein
MSCSSISMKPGSHVDSGDVNSYIKEITQHPAASSAPHSQKALPS